MFAPGLPSEVLLTKQLHSADSGMISHFPPRKRARSKAARACAAFLNRCAIPRLFVHDPRAVRKFESSVLSRSVRRIVSRTTNGPAAPTLAAGPPAEGFCFCLAAA